MQSLKIRNLFILCVGLSFMLTGCKGQQKESAPKTETKTTPAPKKEVKKEAKKADKAVTAPKADSNKAGVFFVSPKNGDKVKVKNFLVDNPKNLKKTISNSLSMENIETNLGINENKPMKHKRQKKSRTGKKTKEGKKTKAGKKSKEGKKTKAGKKTKEGKKTKADKKIKVAKTGKKPLKIKKGEKTKRAKK